MSWARRCRSSEKKLIVDVSTSSTTPEMHRLEGLKMGRKKDLHISHLRAKSRCS
ncbi:hypothetical protein LguiA_029266 [Lonicera macranthoides]